MIASVKEWNATIKNLKGLILKDGHGGEVTEMMLSLHRFVHAASVSSTGADTYEDSLWKRCDGETIRRFCRTKLYSIAWHLWHSTRIEDIAVSHFLCADEEVYHDEGFPGRLGIPFHHTGNSMEYDDMELFNTQISIEQLRSYRDATGKKTREALKRLTVADLKRKVGSESLTKIRSIGSVADTDTWLLEFWGKKTIAGIVTMPLTRHMLVHLNSSFRLL